MVIFNSYVKLPEGTVPIPWGTAFLRWARRPDPKREKTSSPPHLYRALLATMVLEIQYPLVNQHGYWKWPFIVDFPIKNGDFSIVMLVYQRVICKQKNIQKSIFWHLFSAQILLPTASPRPSANGRRLKCWKFRRFSKLAIKLVKRSNSWWIERYVDTGSERAIFPKLRHTGQGSPRNVRQLLQII